MSAQSVSPSVAWQQWRQSRDAEFADPYGWLSLTALEWLGPDPAEVPGAPGLWWVDADGFHADVPADAGLVIDEHRFGSVVVCSLPGASAGRVETPHRSPASRVSGVVVWDGTGDAPAVTVGRRRLELLARGLLKGVRVRDPPAPALQAFAGVPAFDYDPAWRIAADWRPYAATREFTVNAAVPGLQHAQPVIGEVSFDVSGRPYELKVNEGDWIAFTDASNGAGTTRHCRWVDVELGPDGTAVVDFNLSANPPCAFTDFGTCPMPPAGNHLPVPVLAGERDPRQPD